MSTLQPIPSSSFIGPLFSPQKNRRQYDHALNETPSLTDPVFDEVVPREEGFLSKGPLVERYAEAMGDHVERRVAIFFQQLVACYKTGLHFEIGQTQDQGKSAPALFGYNKKGKLKKLSVRNAAHSSTIPCIIAYKRDDWDAYQNDDDGEEPEGFVYLKGTDLYRNANSTIEMPRAINEADIAIDGKSEGSFLRERSIKLLNKASNGEISPEKGVETFLDLLVGRVKSAKDKATDQGVKAALRYYRKILRGVCATVREDSTFFSRMLDVQIDPSDDSALMRRAIYRLRYEAIRGSLLSQAKLLSKIETVKNKIFGQMVQRFCRKEEAFRYVLVGLSKGATQVRLRKLYNLPGEERFNSRYSKTKEEILKHKKAILDLIKDLERSMRRMREEEIRQRASITKTLRAMREWRQVDLSSAIGKAFPHLPSSQSTLSRIETGIRTVDADYAQKLSRVFNVDPGLFMPHFFYD